MATIRLAYDTKAYVPIYGMSRAAFIAAQNVAIRESLSRGPYCYSNEANLTFTGINNGWDIIFSGKSIKGAWAAARIDAWGRGVVYWSTHPSVVAQWKTWPWERIQPMLNNIVGHECGHILLYTTNQTVGIPLTPAMRTRLQSHWGKSVARGADEGWDVPNQAKRSMANSLWNWRSMEHVLTFDEYDNQQGQR